MKLKHLARSELRKLVKRERLMTSLLKGIIDARVGLNWRRVKTITLASGKDLPDREMPAILFGRFGIHKAYTQWAVTDSVTGYLVTYCEQFYEAVFVAGAITTCGIGWDAVRTREDIEQLRDDKDYLKIIERVREAARIANGARL